MKSEKTIVCKSAGSLSESIINRENIITEKEDNLSKFELPNVLLHELFIKKAKVYPDKTAVICNGNSLTYAELDSLANKLANKLINLGVQPGEVVGIGLKPSLQQIVAIYGVLKTGAAYLPLDPSFPIERLQYILEDSEAKFLVSFTDLINDLAPKSSITTIQFESFDVIESYPEQLKLEAKITQENIAYTIYTSGSTGNPKGVLIHHEAAVNFILSMSMTPGITQTDNLLSVTTCSFDISVLEIFLPLSAGATLILANEDERTSRDLHVLIDKYAVTFLQATPSTWNILLSSNWNGTPNLKALCGGEAMLPSLAKSLLPKVSELWNMYGPTETTVWSCCKQITSHESPILIGQPIGNTDIFILDTNNKKLPVNTIGEIAIAGKGISKGYYKQEALTNEKFIKVDGETLYKTGDNGKIRLDGNIEILGRIDNQIKIRGYRIEPGEIEARLCQISGIQEAVVKTHEFDENDVRLIAFLKTSNKDTNISWVRSQLSKHLPDYMIPAIFDVLEEFPQTPNGKIDRNKLTYQSTLETAETTYRNETSPIEREILELWMRHLKIPKIGLTDNFFQIGGDSILAVNLINEIEKIYGCRISFRDFLAEYNSVQKMAGYIGNLHEKSNGLKTDHDNNKYQHMYCLNSEGTKPPVFTIYCEKVFSEKTLLKSEHPIYSFVWPGVDGEEFEFTTVEEVATAYMEQILDIHPNGPFYIAGYSFGGYVAYEIAIMIQNKLGQKPIVVLLDTEHPQVKFEKRDKFLRKKEIYGYPHAVFDYYFLRGFRFFSERYNKAVIQIKKKLNLKFNGDQINELIFGFAMKTGTDYTPGRFDGEVIQFKADENPVRDPDLGWHVCVDKINTFNIKGNHEATLNDVENKLFITDKLYKYFNNHTNEM